MHCFVFWFIKLFDFLFRLEMLKEYEIPAPVHSASLHPEKSVFVCGGDDFKIYKYDYGTGLEIGNIIHWRY